LRVQEAKLKEVSKKVDAAVDEIGSDKGAQDELKRALNEAAEKTAISLANPEPVMKGPAPAPTPAPTPVPTPAPVERPQSAINNEKK
jgi:hypothetical protein